MNALFRPVDSALPSHRDSLPISDLMPIVRLVCPETMVRIAAGRR